MQKRKIMAVNMKTGEVIEIDSNMIVFGVPLESTHFADEAAERAVQGRDVGHLVKTHKAVSYTHLTLPTKA